MEDKQLKIHVTNLKKNFGKLEVLKDISMDVHEGEVVVLLGPSGSGKSTLLRCLNQLETATAGQIIIDGHDVTDKHTDINKVRENIGMVFQHFNLFNHLTVLDNMTLAPVHLKLMSKEEAKAEAMRLLERVGLADKADAFPSQLSGGQKQRVAIARALINRPKVLLLDEPLGALDLKLRKQMQLELKRLQRKLNITFIYVTHDQEEALTMSDRIAIMHDGILDQLGTPTEIYEQPKTKFVATFIGETNIFDGAVVAIDGDRVTVNVENGSIIGSGAGFREGEYISVSVRPEKMKFYGTPVEGFSIQAVVKDYIYVGSVIKCIVLLPNGNELKIERLAGETLPKLGTVIYPYWNPEDAVLIHTQSDKIFEAIENITFS